MKPAIAFSLLIIQHHADACKGNSLSRSSTGGWEQDQITKIWKAVRRIRNKMPATD